MEVKISLFLSLLCYICAGDITKTYNLKWDCNAATTSGKVDLKTYRRVIALLLTTDSNDVNTTIAVSHFSLHHYCFKTCCVLRSKGVSVCKKNGRYVTLLNTRRRQHNVKKACVAIYSEKPVLGTDSWVFDNLALMKKVNGSMPYKKRSLKPDYIVDGREDIYSNIASFKRCSFAATDYTDPDRWWLIDLGRMSVVYGVGVMHSVLYGTPRNVIVEVFPENPKQKRNSNGTVCIQLSGYLQFIIKVTCDQPIIGQYVRLRKEEMIYREDTFALCEVHVYGYVVPEGEEKSSYKLKWDCNDTIVRPRRIDIKQLGDVFAFARIRGEKGTEFIAVSPFVRHHSCNTRCCMLKGITERCYRTGRFIAVPWRVLSEACVVIYSPIAVLGTSSLPVNNLALKKKVTGSMPHNQLHGFPQNIVNGLERMSSVVRLLQKCPFAETDRWWVIDLGRKYVVHGVGLMHSVLHGTPHDTIIEVFAENPARKPNSYGIACIRLSGYLQFKLKVSCTQRIIGRYVRLMKTKMDYPTDTFGLCEVHVYGTIPPEETTSTHGPTIVSKKPGPTIATKKSRTSIATSKPGPTIATNGHGPTTCVTPEDKDTADTQFVPRTIKEMLSCIKQFKKCTVVAGIKPDNPNCFCECLSLKSGVPQKVELMFKKQMENCSMTI